MEQQAEQIRALTVQLLRSQSSASSSSSASVRDFKHSYDGSEGVALEEWISKAEMALKMQSFTPQRATDWLAMSLGGAAMSWWTKELSASTRPITPDLLFAALRKRFQPVLAAQQARSQFFKISQGKLTVTGYANLFSQLLGHMDANEVALPSRLTIFTEGLIPSLKNKVMSSPQQPATMEELIGLASRLEALDAGANRGTAPVAAPIELGPEANPILAALSTLIERGAFGDRKSTNTNGRSNGGNARSRTQSRGPRTATVIEGQSAEQRDKLRKEGRCFHCASSDHMLITCPVRQRGADPTAAALGKH